MKLEFLTQFRLVTDELLVAVFPSHCSGHEVLRSLPLPESIELSPRKSSNRQEKVISTHKHRAGAFDRAEIMIPVYEPRCLITLIVSLYKEYCRN
jgi:hypothetical protein